MLEELHRSIEKLTGSEAKSLLLLLMHRLQQIKESNGLEEEMMQELNSLYGDILGVSQKIIHDERKYKAVHIVCGESSAGSLRVGLGHEHRIIGFPDFFSVGPICDLHKDVGRKQRYEWLKEHLNIEMDYIEEEYEKRINKTLKEIDAVQDHVPIFIWTAENADEQAGMRYFLYLLKEKPNDVFLINTTLTYQELFNSNGIYDNFFHTGMIHPEKLSMMYEKNLATPLCAEERSKYFNEWNLLSETKAVLRIWENNKIKAVKEDYFDHLIIAIAQKLNAEKSFIFSARIIGEVLGNIEQSVIDAFFEYRIRTLIYKGVFEIKGIPKGMRYYSVKLR